MRLIDADKLKIYISEKVPLKKFMSRDVGKACVNMNSILDVVELQPTVDAVPVKHGHWEKSKDKKGQTCSECGVFVFTKHVWEVIASEDKNMNHCTHCGAKMDLDEVSE